MISVFSIVWLFVPLFRVSNRKWRNFRFVDKVCEKCPGSFNVSNWESNSTQLYEPWHSDFITNDYGICTAPKPFCHFDGDSKAFNNCKSGGWSSFWPDLNVWGVMLRVFKYPQTYSECLANNYKGGLFKISKLNINRDHKFLSKFDFQIPVQKIQILSGIA